MKNTEKAFHWIITILERHNIVYKISGGLAARIYGVHRELADIDIEMANSDITKIVDEVKPYIIFGPGQYKDNNWDLRLMTLQYEGQEIDIAETEAKIFNQKTKQWETCSGNLRDIEIKKVFGKYVPVESCSSLIAYKSKLARQVDQEDISQLHMLLSDKIVYSEKTYLRAQPFATVFWLVPIVAWYGAIQQLLFKIPFGNHPSSDTGLVILWIVTGLLLPWFFLRAKLTITVTPEELIVQWFPFHLRPKHFKRTEIASANAMTYHPIREYGGWGIRYGRNGKAYTVKGDRGVQLIFANGKKLLLGTATPEALANALNFQK